MKKTAHIILTFLFGLCLLSCEKEPDIPQEPSTDASSILLVGNEGSFGTNTASLSSINLVNGIIANNIYKNKNGLPLGDVLQSITRIGDSYYFIVNNSNKIVVTDSNFIKTNEITGILSPRYLTAVSTTKAYVTSLFNDKMYVIDLQSNTKVADIEMDKNWTEQMVLTGDATGNYLYVCENDTAINYLTKINVLTDQIVDRIQLAGFSPSKMVVASDNNIWILAGNNYFDKVSTLSEINPVTKQLVQSFTFPTEYTSSQLAIGPQDEKYVTVVDYSTNEYGIFKFEKGATSFPNDFFLNKPATANFYGVTVDPVNGDVYVSDSKGFTQAGDVNRYSSKGVLLNSWTAGIGPSSFYFVR